MAKFRHSPKDIRKEGKALAQTGLHRQEIYDEIVKRFNGRERDIADIVCTVFPLKMWHQHAWSYFVLVGMVAISAAFAFLLPYYYVINFKLFAMGMLPILLANGFFLYALLTFNTTLIQNFYIWSLAQLALAVFAVANEGLELLLMAIATWALIGYLVSRVAWKKLWGEYKHSAYQTRNNQNQIIAVSKIQFIR